MNQSFSDAGYITREVKVAFDSISSNTKRQDETAMQMSEITNNEASNTNPFLK